MSTARPATQRSATLSLKRKVVLGFGFALLLLAAMTVEAYRASAYTRASAAWVEHSHRTLEALNEVVSDLVDVENSQRGYVLTRAPGFLAPYDSNVAQVDEHLRQLAGLTVDNPLQHARADSLGTLAADRIAQLDQRLRLAQAGRLDSAIAGLGAGRMSTYIDTLRAVAAHMDAEERRLLAERAALLDRRRRYGLLVTFASLILGVIVGAAALAAILQDVSARERFAGELEASANREHRANRAKSDFLARMSHELRTPLNSVIGFANVLLKNKHGRLGEQELSYVDRIRSNGTHLLGIINDILDLSKVESGRMDLELAEIDVNALVRESLAQVGGRDGVTVEEDAAPDARPLLADHDKLKQVLLNLVANAMKFTPNGRIVVRVVADARTHVVRRIDVSDTGIGIPADRVGAIFEAFEQADSTTTRRFGGTGLGLAIARSFCERMGFRLQVASEIGLGSTFSILCDPSEPSLERHVPPAASRNTTVVTTTPEGGVPAAAPPPVADADKPMVLVIDDSADARLLVCQYLEDDGKHVVTAVSGEQGIQMARELHPDVIVLDLIMPGMSGEETLQRLKHDDATRAIPVVVVSIIARERRADVHDAAELMDKPVSREQLVETVRRHVSSPDARVLVIET